MTRLFVAVIPPQEVLADLEAFLEPRLAADPDLRWTRPEHWHLTLAFAPSVDRRRQEDLEDRLESVAAQTDSFTLTLDGSGAFPDAAAARVLFLDVDDPLVDLPPLARRVRSAANGAGVRVDGGPFAPHLTVARRRGPGDVTRWLRVLDTYRSPSWTVDEITLVESELGLGPNGTPRYTPRATFPLGR